MKTSYDSDVIAWAQEQANLLRSGQFSRLDIEHIADEIEDVGKANSANSLAEWRYFWHTFSNGSINRNGAGAVAKIPSVPNVKESNGEFVKRLA